MSGLFMGSNLLRGALAFATTVVIARHLGPEPFGTWTLCVTWASMLTFLLDLGFGVMLPRDAAADKTAAGRLLAGALTARLLLFVPVAVLFVASAPWLGLRQEPASLLIAMLLVTATSIAYGTIAGLFRAWPERVPAVLLVEAAGAIVLFGGTWQIARRDSNVGALLHLAAAVQAAQLVVAATWWRGTVARGDAWQWPSLASAVGLVRRAFPFAVAGLIANVQERLGPMMLGRLSGVAEVASFGAAWRIGAAARMLPQAALGGGLPILAAESTNGRSEAIRVRFERALTCFAAIAAPTLAVFSAPLVRLTYGDAFAPAASSLTWIGLGIWPFVVNSARKVGLYAEGREGIAVRFSIITLMVQVATCVALIPRMGAPGAALALAVGEALVWWPLRRYARARS